MVKKAYRILLLFQPLPKNVMSITSNVFYPPSITTTLYSLPSTLVTPEIATLAIPE